MLNNVVAVGRICEQPTFIESENGKKRCELKIAVPRPYKNIDGEYDVDNIPCVLWAGIAENVVAYCKSGDLIGIKGKIQCFGNEAKVVAEKVTFLSAKKDESEEK